MNLKERAPGHELRFRCDAAPMRSRSAATGLGELRPGAETRHEPAHKEEAL